MTFYVSAGKNRGTGGGKVVHAGPDCPLAFDADGKRRVDMVAVDPARLRVFVRCKYCFG
jgi:DNA topoisomerase IB